jgi:hypothetical protein
MGEPPVVNKQKLLDQNISFQSFLRTNGKSRFISRELALFYALMKLDNSVLGCALNKM